MRGIGRQTLRLARRSGGTPADLAHEDALPFQEPERRAIDREQPPERAGDRLEDTVEVVRARGGGRNLHEGKKNLAVGGIGGPERGIGLVRLRHLQTAGADCTDERPPGLYPRGSITAAPKPAARTARITRFPSER